MKILMVAAEGVPFAKVGGLADVVGALPSALHAQGVDVRVVIPKYRSIDAQRFRIAPLEGSDSVQVFLGRIPVAGKFHASVFPGTAIPVYFVENDFFFGRMGIYDDPATGIGFSDNGERFSFFCKAALELLSELQWFPDVIHVHDSQTALLPFYLKHQLQDNAIFRKVGSVLTIHNLGYQGLFPRDILYPAGLPDELFYPGGPLEFFDKVNFMKIGLLYADCINTVSETYALEIQDGEEFGCGLQGVLRSRAQDLFGIINGIDYSIWNPEIDKHIAAHYSAGALSGKEKNRSELARRSGLEMTSERMATVGMISRLADQKGFDLIIESLDQIMALPLRLVILGSGNKKYEEILLSAAARFPGRLSVNLKFDDPLAHLIEAGSDIFLMPSKYEPCGLNQLYSLRYGTVPVVRATGGLRDSVVDADEEPDAGTGFVFGNYAADAMMSALHRAMSAYSDIPRWEKIVGRGMAADFSWGRSAGKYMDLYRRALAKRTRLS